MEWNASRFIEKTRIYLRKLPGDVVAGLIVYGTTSVLTPIWCGIVGRDAWWWAGLVWTIVVSATMGLILLNSIRSSLRNAKPEPGTPTDTLRAANADAARAALSPARIHTCDFRLSPNAFKNESDRLLYLTFEVFNGSSRRITVTEVRGPVSLNSQTLGAAQLGERRQIAPLGSGPVVLKNPIDTYQGTLIDTEAALRDGMLRLDLTGVRIVVESDGDKVDVPLPNAILAFCPQDRYWSRCYG